jgi:hypothetical protein
VIGALFCDRSYFDPPRPKSGPPTQRNNLCITNVIEHITTDRLPTRAKPFMMVAHLIDFGVAVDTAMRVWAPSGADGTHPGYEPEGWEFANPYLSFRLGAFPFFEEGPYRFELLFDDVVARTAVLHVAVLPVTGSISH